MNGIIDFTECQAFCLVVRIGSPPPPLASVSPHIPHLGHEGGITLARGEGVGGPMPTKGQTL
jgi:hypothetical protein